MLVLKAQETLWFAAPSSLGGPFGHYLYHKVNLPVYHTGQRRQLSTDDAVPQTVQLDCQYGTRYGLWALIPYDSLKGPSAYVCVVLWARKLHETQN